MQLATDPLPYLPAPRGYVPAAASPAPGAEPYAEPPLGDVGATEIERLYAAAAAARARMDAPRALAFLRAAGDAARRTGDALWSARIDGLADAVLIENPRTEHAAGQPIPHRPLDSLQGVEKLRALVNHGIRAALDGDLGRALQTFDALLAEAADDAELRLHAHLNRARALAETGDLRAADAAAADALRLARREKHDDWVALASLASALGHLARGRRADARARLGDAARLFARGGDVLRQIQCHYLLGEVAYIGEDPIRAGTHYRDALGIARPVAAQEWIELLTLRFEHR